jgi:hypothetical protein
MFSLTAALAFFAGSAVGQEIGQEIKETDAKVFGPFVIQEMEEALAIYHAFASDGKLNFVGNTMLPPSAPQDFSVRVFDFNSGEEVGALTPPDRGWIRPFSIKVDSLETWGHGRHETIAGRVTVLDSLVPTAAALGLQAMLVEYYYEYSTTDGFSSVMIGQHLLPPNMVYPTDWDRDPQTQRIMMADCVRGVIFTSDSNGENWHESWGDDQWGVRTWPTSVTIDHDNDPLTQEVLGEWVTIPSLAFDGTQQVVPFVTPLTQMGRVTPGLHGIHRIELTDEVAFVSPTPGMPIAAIPRELLLDDSIPYNQKGDPRVIVESQLGRTDWVGVVWTNDDVNPGSRYLNWIRSQGGTSWPGQDPGLQMLGPTWWRVDVLSGEVEKVFTDPNLNFPSHNDSMPCPFKTQEGEEWTCAYAVSTFQTTIPEANGFASDYGGMPSYTPFTMIAIKEEQHHGHGHGHNGHNHH